MTTWLIFCWPMLSGKRFVAFRDSQDWYWPLYVWIEQETEAGGLPLWNPYENFGTSVLADPGCALVYPGKFIMRLPLPSLTHRYACYVALHLLWAALGAYWMAKQMRARSIGAALAGISFAFSGPIYFQSANVIFLVGAAWLPWALGCVWKMGQRTRHGWLFWATMGSLATSMMILGGDVEAAYLVLLISTTTYLGRSIRAYLCMAAIEKQGKQSLKILLRPAVFTLFTLLMSSVQLWPTIELALRSERASQNNSAITNVWPWLTNPLKNRSEENRIWSTPKIGTHHDHIYQFSQPPWTIIEFLIPNYSGIPDAAGNRWSDQIPGSDRMWHSSMYQSIIVIAIVAIALRLRSRVRDKWLLNIAAVMLVGSFGWYGPIWLFRELGLYHSESLGNPVGGIYWLLTTLLPGFEMFRYPAKLIPIVSLMIATLAGISLDRIFNQQKLISQILLGLIVAVFGIALATQTGLISWLQNRSTHPVGSLGQWDYVSSSLWMNAGTAMTILFGMFLITKWYRVQRVHWGLAILVGLSADIVVSNSKILNLSPQSAYEAKLKNQGQRVESSEKRLSLLEKSIQADAQYYGSKKNLIAGSRKLGATSSLADKKISDFIVASFDPTSQKTPLGCFLKKLADYRNSPPLPSYPCYCLQTESPSKVVDNPIFDLSISSGEHPNKLRTKQLFFVENHAVFEINRLSIHIDNPTAEERIILLPIANDDYWTANVADASGTTNVENPLKIGDYFVGIRLPKQTAKIDLVRRPLWDMPPFWISCLSGLVLSILTLYRLFLNATSNRRTMANECAKVV